MMDANELQRRFEYHPPLTDAIKDQHQRVRTLVGNLAHTLNADLPDGREKSLVMTHLEDAMMWANAAIARNQG